MSATLFTMEPEPPPPAPAKPRCPRCGSDWRYNEAEDYCCACGAGPRNTWNWGPDGFLVEDPDRIVRAPFGVEAMA